MGWLIALGILVLLMLLPLGIRLVYNTHGFFAALMLGPVRITLYPAKRVKKEKKKKEDKTQSKPVSAKKQQEDKSGGSLTDFLPLLQTGLDFLNAFRKKLRVDMLEFKLILAGGDPCDLALNYGRAWSVLGSLLPCLEQVFVIKKRSLEVECDFCGSQTLVLFRMDLTVTLGRLLALVICYGIRLLRDYMKIMNKRKGGANL